MKELRLALHYLIFGWYYRRVEQHYKERTFKNSVLNLWDNYQHSKFVIKGLEEVIHKASKREAKMRSKISILELRARGITQETLDPLNEMFGTDLKGISKEEKQN